MPCKKKRDSEYKSFKPFKSVVKKNGYRKRKITSRKDSERKKWKLQRFKI